MTFVLPNYSAADNRLWGPAIADREEGPRVYSKAERLGRIVDWQILDEDELKEQRKKAAKGAFKEVKNVAELKELKRERKEKTQGPGMGRGRGMGRGAAGGRGAQFNRGGRGGRGYAPKEQVFNAATVKIKEDMFVVPIEYVALQKAEQVDLRAPVDVAVQGKCQVYDEKIETTASALKPFRLPPLRPSDPPPREVGPVTQDAVMRQYIADHPTRRVIFGSDVTIARLMTCTHSVNSFDVQVSTNGKFIAILERLKGETDASSQDSRLDYEWVNETAPFNVPSEDASSTGASNINTSVPMALENARVTRIFQSQTKQKAVVGWQGGEKSQYKTNSIFRYRKWTLNPGSDDEVDVVVRCEIDAATKPSEKGSQYMRLFSLLEGPPHDDVVPWKRQADKEGTLLIKSINTNKGKVTYWAALSLLAGVDMLKIALVNRISLASNEAHEVISVATCATANFASQLGISQFRMFEILNVIANNILKAHAQMNRPVMTFYLMKEPKSDRLFIIDPTSGSQETGTDESSSDSDSDSDDRSDESSDSDDE
jgi:hypothetical protein